MILDDHLFFILSFGFYQWTTFCFAFIFENILKKTIFKCINYFMHLKCQITTQEGLQKKLLLQWLPHRLYRLTEVFGIISRSASMAVVHYIYPYSQKTTVEWLIMAPKFTSLADLLPELHTSVKLIISCMSNGHLNFYMIPWSCPKKPVLPTAFPTLIDHTSVLPTAWTYPQLLSHILHWIHQEIIWIYLRNVPRIKPVLHSSVPPRRSGLPVFLVW